MKPERIKSIDTVPVVPDGITEEEEALFFRVTSIDLDETQRERILMPAVTFPRQKSVLGVHWHPEHVPMELIDRRVATMFPSQENALIIPTQHNQILEYKGYAGVEVDCYSSGFNQKVQLLLHFQAERVAEATTLKEMLAHTFKYRSSQLFDFMRTLTLPLEDRLDAAAAQTGASAAVARFTRDYVMKISHMVDRHMDRLSPHAIKNKLLRNYFDGLRPAYGDALINRVQTFLTAVKQIVKANFPLEYFYRTSEVIEEARSLGAGIVIPHPEQFWPILLADYDVDGIEVWNPQSQRYTRFLVSVLNEKNRKRPPGNSRLLIFMGDDTHMGEKTRQVAEQNPEKAAREIGAQPAWEDLEIRKVLILADFTRQQVIDAYRDRLGEPAAPRPSASGLAP